MSLLGKFVIKLCIVAENERIQWNEQHCYKAIFISTWLLVHGNMFIRESGKKKDPGYIKW